MGWSANHITGKLSFSFALFVRCRGHWASQMIAIKVTSTAIAVVTDVA